MLVIAGAGQGFCSGANLAGGTGAGEADVDGGAPLLSHFNPFIRRIRDSRVPVITAVRGAAAELTGARAALAIYGPVAGAPGIDVVRKGLDA